MCGIVGYVGDQNAVPIMMEGGCGSAYYMGQIGALVIELAGVPADAESAFEFHYRNPVIEPDTLYVAVSHPRELTHKAAGVQPRRDKPPTRGR